MSYQNPKPAVADIEKVTPPKLLVPCHDYQATYRVAGSALPERQARRRTRFRALTAILITLVFVSATYRVLGCLSRFVSERGNSSGMHHPVDVPDDCTFAQWDFDPEGIVPLDHFDHVAATLFELPLDSDEMFFVSHGATNFANGVITISDDGEPGSDIVKVDVLGYYNSEYHFKELTKVCQLEHEDRKNGVGIFAPRHWTGHQDRYHRMQFRIHVRLPSSTDGSPVAIKKLTTSLSTFVHYLGDLKETIRFKELSLRTANTPIYVDSVVADAASAHSSNSLINGSFNTSHFLTLETSNSPITVDIGLFNDNSGAATKARLRTSNGPISANVSLFATSGSSTGGRFDVSAHSSNSPVRVAFPHAPADHILSLAVHTSNSPLDLVLHPAFEGGFTLHGSRWMAPYVRVDDDVEDPAGKGRRRDVSFRQVRRGDVTGEVRWLPSEERQLGLVTASTSNMGITLSL